MKKTWLATVVVVLQMIGLMAMAQGSIGVGSGFVPLTGGVAAEIPPENFINKDGFLTDRRTGEHLFLVKTIAMDEFEEASEGSDQVKLGEVSAIRWRGHSFTNAGWFFCDKKDQCVALFRNSDSKNVDEILKRLIYVD